jgi:hypothetical protein
MATAFDISIKTTRSLLNRADGIRPGATNCNYTEAGRDLAMSAVLDSCAP